MITNLKDMMVDRLKLFQKKNSGKLPERVLVYRDGVSEVCLGSVYSLNPVSLFLGSIQHCQRTGTTSDLRSLPDFRHTQGTLQAKIDDHHLWQTPPHAFLPH